MTPSNTIEELVGRVEAATVETGAPKTTAINTIEGGIRQARVAISKAQQEAS